MISIKLLRPIRRTTPRTSQPTRLLIRNIRAQILHIPLPILPPNINPLKRQVLTRRRGTTVDPRPDIISRRAADILPSNIRNPQSGAITVLASVDAGRDVDR